MTPGYNLQEGKYSLYMNYPNEIDKIDFLVSEAYAYNIATVDSRYSITKGICDYYQDERILYGRFTSKCAEANVGNVSYQGVRFIGLATLK